MQTWWKLTTRKVVPSFLCCSNRDILMSRSMVWYRIRPMFWSSCPSCSTQDAVNTFLSCCCAAEVYCML